MGAACAEECVPQKRETRVDWLVATSGFAGFETTSVDRRSGTCGGGRAMPNICAVVWSTGRCTQVNAPNYGLSEEHKHTWNATSGARHHRVHEAATHQPGTQTGTTRGSDANEIVEFLFT